MRAALRPISTAVLLAAFVAVSSTALDSQDKGTTTIRSTTRLVQLNVVVVDKQNRPISGLSQEDFHVFDNGHEQKLVHFAVSTSSGNSVSASESPLVINNRALDQQQSPRTMTVILADDLLDHEIGATDIRNTMQQAKLEVLKFLRTVQPGEQVAIYALRAEGVVIVHDFTDNSEALVAAAKTLGSGMLRSKIHMAPTSPAAATASAQASFGVRLASRNDALTERVHQVIVEGAFQSIAEQLRYVPGRKNLVWISATFPMLIAGFDTAIMMQERNTAEPAPGAHGPLPIPKYAWPENYIDRMTKFARSLSNANVAVYPIDARGLIGGIAVGAGGPPPSPYMIGASYQPGYQAGTGQVATNAGGVTPGRGPSVGPFLSQWSAMDLVASETGGRAFYDRNGIAPDLREVADENRVAYILGYYPGDQAWDGKYHKVEVKVDRESGVVRCRKGYFARDDAPPEGPDPVLRRAAKSLTDNAGIEVTLNVATNPLRWFNQDVVVKVRTQDLHFEQAEERYNDHLEIAFVQIGKDGRVVDGVKDDVTLALLPESYDQALDLGWFYPRSISINPAAEKLRVLVRDVATGDLGSVSVPVQDPLSK